MILHSYSETPIQIIVNGRAVFTLMTHAADPADLVLGALYTERVIESAADIDSVIIDLPQVSVVTKNPAAILLSRKTVLAGCGGASSFLDTGRLGTVTETTPVSDRIIYAACRALPLSRWVWAGLFDAAGGLITAADDISAQNAVDRLIGFGLKNRVGFSDTFMVLAGNCTAETMRKAVIAKIPVIAITGDATSAAEAAAKAAGLRLICC